MRSVMMSPDLALTTLFEREVSNVFGFLLLRCGSRAVAEDLTSQTFMAASEMYADGRGYQVSAGWLTTVARRRLVDYWRSVDAQRRRFTKLASIGPEVTPPHESTDEEVIEALASMPDRQRAVLVLRYLDDFSISEVAEALGISYKATESLLARAKASFSEAYAKGTR